jgi:hypothetical protein
MQMHDGVDYDDDTNDTISWSGCNYLQPTGLSKYRNH